MTREKNICPPQNELLFKLTCEDYSVRTIVEHSVRDERETGVGGRERDRESKKRERQTETEKARTGWWGGGRKKERSRREREERERERTRTEMERESLRGKQRDRQRRTDRGNRQVRIMNQYSTEDSASYTRVFYRPIVRQTLSPKKEGEGGLLYSFTSGLEKENVT